MSIYENSTEAVSITSVDIIFNSVCLHVIGFVGIAANIFTIFVIRRNKELQSPCFLLISGDCFCSILLASGLMENAVEEMGHYIGYLSEYRPRWLCYLSKGLISTYAVIGSCLTIMFIGLDRLMSVWKPGRYRQLGKRYAYVCLAISYSVAAVGAVSGFGDKTHGFELTDVIRCTFPFDSLTKRYIQFFSGFNLFSSISCILLYALILVVFEWRRRQLAASATNDNSTLNIFMKQQMAILPVIKLLLAYYLVTAAAPEVVVAVMATNQHKTLVLKWFYYVSIVRQLKCLSEVLALSYGSRLFRQCAIKAYRKMLGKVAPNNTQGRGAPGAQNGV